MYAQTALNEFKWNMLKSELDVNPSKLQCDIVLNRFPA